MTVAQEHLLLELARFNIITMHNVFIIDPPVLRRAVDKLQTALEAVELERSECHRG